MTEVIFSLVYYAVTSTLGHNFIHNISERNWPRALLVGRCLCSLEVTNILAIDSHNDKPSSSLASVNVSLKYEKFSVL
jgi:hypothetical protein